MNQIIKAMFGTACSRIRVALDVMLDEIDDNEDIYTSTDPEDLHDAEKAVDKCYAVISNLASTIEIFANYAGLLRDPLKSAADGRIHSDCEKICSLLDDISDGLKSNKFEELTDIEYLLSDAYVIIDYYRILSGERLLFEPEHPDYSDEKILEFLNQGNSFMDFAEKISKEEKVK